MIRFNCDYNEGTHPAILERLAKTNMEQIPGYGEDHYCRQAAQLLREKCQAPQADVHFLVGGTQTNLTVIASALKPYQCVISADSGHINVHETGAIEATGHRIISVPGTEGKISAAQIQQVCDAHYTEDNPEFSAQPKMVYISFPTEYGTLYTKQELQELHDVCQKNNLLLFADGARLGYALTAKKNTVSLPELAALCDVFYIGGTKVGALFGEAVVIMNPDLKKDFRYYIKQRGAMLAKGWLLGLQFLTLFEDDLYLNIARRANEFAARIKKAFQKAGFPLLYNSPTNQQFPILPNEMVKKLEKKYVLAHFGHPDDKHTVIRVCTSWATTEEHVAALEQDIADLSSL